MFGTEKIPEECSMQLDRWL